MSPRVEYLTAESEQGREALAAVMRQSYEFDLSAGPPKWTLARLVGGEPVSLIQVDPQRQMQFPGGGLPYAFITNAATREDRRRQGHFRATMVEASRRLLAAGLPMIVTHGRWALYKSLGFSVFTHHSGVFVTVETIRRALGQGEMAAAHATTIHDRGFVSRDLLVLSEVRARTEHECLLALRQAAHVAERMGKTRILFEEPPAPSYGSDYHAHATPSTIFARVAVGIGACHTVQGGEPEDDPVPDADWLKVLDTHALLCQALSLLPHAGPLPVAAVAFADEAGTATLASDGSAARVTAGVETGAAVATWPSAALAQLITGYRGAQVLDALFGPQLPGEALALLESLFPPSWRLSRNESWTYGP